MKRMNGKEVYKKKENFKMKMWNCSEPIVVYKDERKVSDLRYFFYLLLLIKLYFRIKCGKGGGAGNESEVVRGIVSMKNETSHKIWNFQSRFKNSVAFHCATQSQRTEQD